MEFKEKQEFQLKQVCDRCGKLIERCSCTPGVVQETQVSLPNYALGEVVCDAARSTIFRAKHLVTGQMFAAKLIKSKPIEDRTAQRKLQQEGKAITSLTHPHIAAVYDWGLSNENMPFIARDYVEGISVAELIDKEGSLEKERFFEIFSQVANALSYAHENGVLHLGLKPENIIVTKEAGATGDFIKVVDFAVQRMLPHETQEDRERVAAADARYLSPEQCKGTPPVSSATDVYALGCIMYEALCGHPPFTDGTTLELMNRQISLPPSPVNAIARHRVSSALEALVMRCLGKEPRTRPQSAAEIEEELEAIASGKVLEQPPAAPAHQQLSREHETRRSSINPNVSKLIGGGAIVLVLVIGLFMAFQSVPKVAPTVVAQLPAWRVHLNQAIKYQQQGNDAKAEEFFKLSLKDTENDEVADKDMAEIYAKLGSHYYSTARYRDAAPFLVQALLLYESVEGQQGQNVDWIATELVQVAQSTNNWRVAVEMYQKLMPIREKQTGKDSPKYGALLAGLGSAYIHLHDYPAAEQSLKGALAILERNSGKAGVDSLSAQSKTLLNLGYVFDLQGNNKEADKYYLQAISAAQKATPQDKESTVKATEYYANFLKRTGRKAQGDKLTKQTRALKGLPPEPAVTHSQTGSSHGGTSRLSKLKKLRNSVNGVWEELKNQR